MLPGKRDFYRCCKARRSASHVNKEFWQQFQNYAPPSLRVIRTKIARTIYIIYNIRDSQLNRPESVSLASLARQIYIYMCVQKKFVIERTRDLNYLKFVATDFSPKKISPSAVENSGDLA